MDEETEPEETKEKGSDSVVIIDDDEVKNGVEDDKTPIEGI